jgi:HAD superfamily hydrolase (TIGR01484 family)
VLSVHTSESFHMQMRNLTSAPFGQFKNVRFVLTDMDETLTYKGRLSAPAYAALEQLRSAGLRVIVVTAAPAGWCDQMARMWPVDGVIGENGGLYYRRDERGLLRDYWHTEAERVRNARRLAEIGDDICATVPGAALADDQPFRLTSIAFTRPRDEEAAQNVVNAMINSGLHVTRNNLWLLGWIGDFDKLAMTRRVLQDVDEDAICYLGDSENDAQMFAAFRHSIGMCTVRDSKLSSYPTWGTNGPGGAGFVEAAKIVLASSW